MTSDHNIITRPAATGVQRHVGAIDAVADYALILAVIYNSNSLWALAGDHFSLSCITMFFVALAYLVYAWWRRTRLARQVLAVIVALALFTLIGQLILAVAHGSGLTSGIWVQYALILPTLAGCLLMRGQQYIVSHLLPRLVYVAAFFAAVSVVLWLLTSFLPLPPTRVTTMNWTADAAPLHSYLGLYYNVQDAHVLGMTVWRNSSIFNEPPCASAFYGTVLAFDLYVVRRPHHWIADLCIVGALLTSLSTGGMLYVLVLFVPLVWKAMAHIRSTKVRYACMGGAGLLSVIAVIAGVYLAISKIATSYSGQTHLKDFTVGLRIWWDHPLVGFGFYSDDYLWQHYISSYRSGMGYTSGLMFLLIHGGLILTLYMIVPWVLMLWGEHDWHIWYFAAFILLVFVTVPIQNCAFLLLAAAYGYARFIWRYNERMSQLPLVKRLKVSAYA